MGWWRMPYLYVPGDNRDRLTYHGELPGLRAAPKEDSGTSSAELVHGSPLLLPRELLHARHT
jgi:hypothetical protein